MNNDIKAYNSSQAKHDRELCKELMKIIDTHLHFTEQKIWHAHPVWFIDGNPIVGYSKRKDGINLMFWSGADFDEKDLKPGTGKFKDASMQYTSKDQIDEAELKRWLVKAEQIQWDYKNIVRRKGRLEKIRSSKETTDSGELPKIGAPALRALDSICVTNLSQLTNYTEKELLVLHGFGPKALRILQEKLKELGLSLKK